jgi:pyruvate/2-oxoglutarate dehydrogenase complex dihydrolipoamide dehydrogenase (E3) component
MERRARVSKIGRTSPTFDVVVIGGGSAGIAAIEGARAAGAKSVCLVEAEARLGGECAFWACIPTKAMLKAGQVYHQAKFAAGRYGVRTGKVTYDFSALLHRRDAVVRALTGNGSRLLEFTKKLKVTVKHGSAHFISDKMIDVKGERIRAKAFVIATGSKERTPILDGIDTVPVWYSRDVVTMKSLPSSVLIIGGGPIGTEFSTLFGLLGVKTTLLEYGEHILPREDAEIAALAEVGLQQRGVRVLTKTKPLGIKREGSKFKVTFQEGRKPRQTVTVEKVIAAVGRHPNLIGLTLDRAGVAVDEHGKLQLSSSLQTNLAHIFAAGDANSRFQFTHVANHEGYIAGWNAAQVKLDGKRLKVEETIIPRITFSDPEVASVGMTVIEATKAKKKFKVVRFPFSALGRAAIDGNREGLIKIVVENKSGLILGAHVIGERAGEIMHELALAMHLGAPLSAVQGMLHAYPSWSEVIPAAE